MHAFRAYIFVKAYPRCSAVCLFHFGPHKSTKIVSSFPGGTYSSGGAGRKRERREGEEGEEMGGIKRQEVGNMLQKLLLS